MEGENKREFEENIIERTGVEDCGDEIDHGVEASDIDKIWGLSGAQFDEEIYNQPKVEEKGTFRQLNTDNASRTPEDEMGNLLQEQAHIDSDIHKGSIENQYDNEDAGSDNTSDVLQEENYTTNKFSHYSWIKNDTSDATHHKTQKEDNQSSKRYASSNENDDFSYGSISSKPKKQKKTGKLRQALAMGLVFGLVAGSTMFGINYAGNRLWGNSHTNEPSQTISKVDTAKPLPTPEQTVKDRVANTEDQEADVGDYIPAGSVADVAQNALPSLTTISVMSVQEMQSFFGGSQQYEVEGAGTGVIVGQNDTELLIATNNHVVEGATEVTVGFVDEEVVEAFVKGTDANNDLAVIGVKQEDIPEETKAKIKTVAIGESDNLQLGEQVVAIGNALGYGQSVTSGYISALDRELELSDGRETFVSSGLIQTDAAINSGNSGGALLNMKGELIGINEAKSSGSDYGASVDNVAYAIPISKAKPILEELMSLETKEKVAEDEKGYLGVICADVNQETFERYNIPVGVYVRDVAENGPASKAGVITGDVITKLDGKTISSYSDLTDALEYCKNGESVEVVVQRPNNGQYEEQTISVTLGAEEILENMQTEKGDERGMRDRMSIGEFGD